MFGIGFAEIVVILIVALLVFGPDRLPEMTKQAASFVRDLRKMVANARRDIAVTAQDLGIDEEDLRTLRELRNPKAFVRDKVLDGIDLEDLGLDDGLDDGPNAPADRNGGSRPHRTSTPEQTSASGATSPSGGRSGSGSASASGGTPPPGAASVSGGTPPPGAPVQADGGSDVPYDPDAT